MPRALTPSPWQAALSRAWNTSSGVRGNTSACTVWRDICDTSSSAGPPSATASGQQQSRRAPTACRPAAAGSDSIQAEKLLAKFFLWFQFATLNVLLEFFSYTVGSTSRNTFAIGVDSGHLMVSILEQSLLMCTLPFAMKRKEPRGKFLGCSQPNASFDEAYASFYPAQ